MKCSKCNSTNIQDIGDSSYELYVCVDCGYYWVVGEQKVQYHYHKQELNKKTENAWKYFNTIKMCLEGIFEILQMGMNEDSIYFLCGMDNLKNLRDGLVDLLSNEYTTKEMRIKLRDLEFKLKKNIFFNACQKRIEIEE